MMTTNQGLGRSSDSLLVRSCSIPESIAAKWEMEEYLIVIIIIIINFIFLPTFQWPPIAKWRLRQCVYRDQQKVVCRRAPESLLPESHRWQPNENCSKLDGYEVQHRLEVKFEVWCKISFKIKFKLRWKTIIFLSLPLFIVFHFFLLPFCIFVFLSFCLNITLIKCLKELKSQKLVGRYRAVRAAKN